MHADHVALDVGPIRGRTLSDAHPVSQPVQSALAHHPRATHLIIVSSGQDAVTMSSVYGGG